MTSVKDKRVSPYRNICEVHRELYRQILKNIKSKQQREEMIETLEEAYFMGKRMNTKLHQYKKGYNKDWYEKNKNYETLKKEMGKK
jgi:predicted patatin/cPLA2 family phospholipase